MPHPDAQPLVAALFAELVDGAASDGGAFVLNSGDIGLLRSLSALSSGDASAAVAGGASVAAHATHLSYGLSLMNRWARQGGNPFADARWDQAWTTTEVTARQWEDIQLELSREARDWLAVLGSPRDLSPVELQGLIASVAHLAYHLGAIRQIARTARGPREGTFT
ncbi:MAG TPA: hypothetical protein VMW48_19850 [Vicinamibacterales bacterium]|nr:hypothetical protein [Vicinamibacterales bacterium]